MVQQLKIYILMVVECQLTIFPSPMHHIGTVSRNKNQFFFGENRSISSVPCIIATSYTVNFYFQWWSTNDGKFSSPIRNGTEAANQFRRGVEYQLIFIFQVHSFKEFTSEATGSRS